MQAELQRKIYTVSELTADIKHLLEERYPFVWISGEVSNFHVPASKHFYFTLKDQKSQISGIMFRGQNRNLKFMPEDGMSIVGLGRISVYEPRGSYQIIFEYLEPRGIGELQIAFEQLKSGLAAEGLFDEAHKKPIPFLPRNIGVVTSGTGAVLHDIIKVAHRRFPGVGIRVVPVKVQGAGAEDEIVRAIALLNRKESDVDTIILARGGGSLEDFQAFNSEAAARAVYASDIPVISGVGHETDFTIVDFVADLRAPTPSAAAEMAVPLKSELVGKHMDLAAKLFRWTQRYITQKRQRVAEVSRRLVHPKRRVEDFRMRLEDLTDRLAARFREKLERQKERLNWERHRLRVKAPTDLAGQLAAKLERCRVALFDVARRRTGVERMRTEALQGRLETLSPMVVLKRGYSITQTVPEAEIVRNAGQVAVGQALDVRVAVGVIRCRVEERFDIDDETDV
ncbi:MULTISPECIES: exodeoxyribonuclease VII large subunit [Desulfococcus]|uniref:Exodeoxyribonuclease 7 large subunit n=1 Tax=Desulfococcus multivorans DSM 2059 TaxID=1121405 RepID=S7UY02_DESML|nr:exodeoxyribonuclease VII large subunit [Desulfococcus multivorans]AQV01231.1 exodeoxyribonuclease VII large subunit [Desulfococcus multivorans]EPR39129.1 Exodeoxyribonuclease 7 large subunit [Desulfococcus multivorans DSM 2059]SJZ54246.1 Exodeoxyribonuclease VII large subunit [Desulfococcus multivorans DSM 2059]